MSYYSFYIPLQPKLLYGYRDMNINSFYMIIGVNNQDLLFRNVKSRDSFSISIGFQRGLL